jgi:hypothetical protein
MTNAKYGPESDFTSIARIVEEYAGVEIKSPAADTRGSPTAPKLPASA